MANALLLQPLSPAAITATTTATGYAPANMSTDYAGVVWRAAVGASVNLIIDLGADVSFDSLMLFGVSGAAISGSMTVDIATAAQGSAFTGTFWTSGALLLFAGTTMPISGKGVAFWAAPNVSGPPAAARYIRLRFYALGSTAELQIARLVVGRKIQLARNFVFGAGFGVRDLGSLDFSRRGVLLRSRGAKLRNASLSFSSASKDEVETSIKPLIEQIGNTEMIALVTDPAVDAQRQNRCYYGAFVGDLQTVWRNAVAWEWKANLVSVF